MMKHARGLVLALTTTLATGCGGEAPADDAGADDGATDGGPSSDAAGVRTDHVRVVVEMGGERWTGFDCPRVVRVFASPTSGRIPTVPTMCVVGVGMTPPGLNLEVNGLANYETGRWTGDDIPRHVQVDFEGDGHELDNRTDAIDPASAVTISTWDPEGLIEGDLDLALTSAGGRGTIRGPFTIAFEVR